MGSMRHPAVRTRYRGTLTLWNAARYFGFITTTSGLPDIGNTIFVHRLNFMSGIPTASILAGIELEFEIGPAYKVGTKPQAVRVKIVEPLTAGVNALAASQGGGHE